MMNSNPIEDIKSRLNIVDIVQDYVKLTRAGSNYKAVCPFHQEKTPSFMVSADKQIWHCFGCNEGGDLLSFVQKIEGVEFPEVLRMLAAKAGVTLERQDPKAHNERTKLQDICLLAAKYFRHVLLKSPPAAEARDYLKGRGVSEATVEDFMIGYAPAAWDGLYNFLRKKGHVDRDIQAAGLIIKREQGVGFYDRFRDRVMFPLRDVHGNVVGFSGRLLHESENAGGKYINTPQTAIYDKSRVLYGLDRARTDIRKNDAAVLVEGQMDVVTAHQAGFYNVIAASGTALTEQQVSLLKRFSLNIKMCFDADSAGESAARRGIDVALRAGLNVDVVTIPSGKDPDESIRHDPQEFRQALQHAQPFMDFLFATALRGADMHKPADKKKIAALLLPPIRMLPDTIERSHYVRKLSQVLEVPEEVLYASLGAPVSGRSRRTMIAPSAAQQARTSADRADSLADHLLSFCLKSAQLVDMLDKAGLYDFLPSEQQKLYKIIQSYYTQYTQKDDKEWPGSLLAEVSLQKLALLADYYQSGAEEESFDWNKEALFQLQQLKKIITSRRLRQLQTEIAQLEQQPSSPRESLQQRLDEFTSLTAEFHKL